MPVTTGPARPRVSRETRLLLGIVVMSLVALWVLARLRFPQTASSPNPVPPLLTQLTPHSTFEDLALSISQLEPRLTPLLMTLPLEEPLADGRSAVPALRVREEIAVTVEPRAADGGAISLGRQPKVLATDPASGFTAVGVPSAKAPPLNVWMARRLEDARYLVASDVSGNEFSFRPVFIGSLYAVFSPAWSGRIWIVPPGAHLSSGTFVFSTEGALAGLVTLHEGRPAIVPGDLLMKTVDRLLVQSSAGTITPGHLGIDVQPIGHALRAATGATGGVIVSGVDPAGPASGHVVVTDVIEAVNGENVESPEYWYARVRRLRAGDTLTLRVRRRGDIQDVQVSAAARAAPDRRPSLGIIMQALRGVGVEVVRVQPASAAARAGIQAGDVLTVFDTLDAPTPAQVAQAYASAPAGRPLVVAITRGEMHHVLTLDK